MVEIFGEQQREADALCNQGIDLCEVDKNFPAAHELFMRAYETDPHSAKIQSWLGYTTGIVEKKVAKGMELCRKAIDSNIPDATFFRNMGKLYLLQNNKRAAIGAFSKGLQIDKTNRQILSEWKQLGFRRKPFFGFLSRDNWFNKKIGMMTWKSKKLK